MEVVSETYLGIATPNAGCQRWAGRNWRGATRICASARYRKWASEYDNAFLVLTAMLVRVRRHTRRKGKRLTRA